MKTKILQEKGDYKRMKIKHKSIRVINTRKEPNTQAHTHVHLYLYIYYVYIHTHIHICIQIS